MAFLETDVNSYTKLQIVHVCICWFYSYGTFMIYPSVQPWKLSASMTEVHRRSTS